MFEEHFEKINTLLKRCVYTTKGGPVQSEKALQIAHFFLDQVKKVEGSCYLIGNGGSAAIASHFCTDLIRTLEISAHTFSDCSLLTCFSNDFGFENSYQRLLARLLSKKDLLIAISSSGNSENIVKAAQFAKEKKACVITFSGFSPLNRLRKLGDLNFWLDSEGYGLVEAGHFFLLHTIIDTCEKKFSHSVASRAL